MTTILNHGGYMLRNILLKNILLFLLLGSSATLWAEAIPILSKIHPGNFIGVARSYVDKAVKSTPGKLSVRKTNEGILFTFVMDGAEGKSRQEWLMQGADLVQRKYDAEGKLIDRTIATITPARPVGEQEATFAASCGGPEDPPCGSGVGAKDSWTISSKGDVLKYTQWGAGDGGVDAPLVKKQEMIFQATRQ